MGASESLSRVEKLVAKLPVGLTKLRNQARLLYELVRAYRSGEYRQIPYWSISMAVAAMLYLLNPLDLVPDFIPVIGQIDDALVLGLTVKALQGDLKRFCEFRGYDLAQYF